MSEDNDKVDYHWSPERYIDLVENTRFPMLQEYQRVELEYIISKIQTPQSKTFIDIGAGYGRVMSQLAGEAKRVIAIELDEEMLEELKRRAEGYRNVDVVSGNGNSLAELLKDKMINNPVLLSLQNSLGTWKGDYHLALDGMRQIAEAQHGEVIVSLLRQEAFEEQAIPMYTTLAELVGEPDLERTDTKRGVFRSKTDYKSQWWTSEQRAEMTRILGGQKAGEVLTPNFWIIHLQYPSK